MYIYIHTPEEYIYIYLCVYIYIYTYIHTQKYIYIHIYIYIKLDPERLRTGDHTLGGGQRGGGGVLERRDCECWRRRGPHDVWHARVAPAGFTALLWF